MIIPYWVALLGLSLVFVFLERIKPWRRISQPRPEMVSDLLFLVFNGYFLALLLAPLAAKITPYIDHLVVPLLGKSHVAFWPLSIQFVLAFFLMDFIQWGIHNLMHRVPWLWSFHRVHHSIVDMDWLGSMRFHWFEVVVYRFLQYLPLLLLGFHWQVLAWLAVFSTLMGHFNHSNLKVRLGPLRFFLNHPAMHIWHHDLVPHGKYGCNFGINLSLWDWLFGTAFLPDNLEQPAKLGFQGVSRFPKGFFRRQIVL